MKAVTWLLLAAALRWCSSGEDQPFTCREENGPSPELMMRHNFTPSDLFELNFKIVEVQGECKFNISWIINADSSIRYLTATKICVSAENTACVRCDYTEKFQSQTTLGGQRWQFHYDDFPVQDDDTYFIEAYNLPPANIGADHPKIYQKYTSPDCEDNLLKHCKTCIEKGSLWDPNITVCYKKSEVEVSFTPSNFSTTYTILLCESDECSDHTVDTSKRNDTRVSERIQLTGQTRKIFRQLIPFFPKCQNDCQRYSHFQLLCPEEATTGKITTDPVDRYVYLFAALLCVLCVIAAVLVSKGRHSKRPGNTLSFCQESYTAINWSIFHQTAQHIPATVLVVYSQEVCFQHTVLVFAEFLHECCQSNVIIDAWQKRRIAELGPVQWLASQKEIADKVVFFSPNHTSPTCDSACKRTIENNKNSECMFTLAFNLFCSDWKNQSSLHKYMVVSFNETNPFKSLPAPLNICPKYFLMKDIDSFCRDLCLSPSSSCSEVTKAKYSWRFKMKQKSQV